MTESQERSLSFGSAAAAYERGRPSYPPEAIDWLLPSTARHVLDLGAGTVVGVGGLFVLGVATVATARATSGPTTSVPRLARSAAPSNSTRRLVVAGAVTVLTGIALGVGAVLPLLDVSTGSVPTSP